MHPRIQTIPMWWWWWWEVWIVSRRGSYQYKWQFVIFQGRFGPHASPPPSPLSPPISEFQTVWMMVYAHHQHISNLDETTHCSSHILSFWCHHADAYMCSTSWFFCVLFLFCLVFTSKGNIENCPASKHEIRWFLILSWRNRILLGSYPKQSATMFAISKSPQSTDPCCCWTGTLFTVTMLPSYFNIAQIWLFTWESGSKFKLS